MWWVVVVVGDGGQKSFSCQTQELSWGWVGVVSIVIYLLFIYIIIYLFLMSTNMFPHMIWPRESPCTNMALERFEPCMFPLVSGELVWPGELVFTPSPRTAVWPLPSVCAHMGLQIVTCNFAHAVLLKPQLNHNSTQPNITLSWVRHENDFAHHPTLHPPNKLNVSYISVVTYPILMKL